jgi:cysteine desulfurase/selenocysteine lyase
MMADTGIGVLALWRVLQKAWKCPIGGGGAINYVSETTHEQAGIPEKWQPGTPHITGAVSMQYAIEHLEQVITTKKHHQDLIKYTQSRFLELEKK